MHENVTGNEEIDVISADEMTGNFAYIDNQNLYMATHRADDPWDIDMRKFRAFLREKYNVVYAYLFMGAFQIERQDMYRAFQEYGYVLIFREHGMELKGKKKGNVDVDVVFEMMRDNFTSARMERAVLVSGDGDYFRTVDYLVDMGKFERVLLPSRKNASSLYKQLSNRYFAYLDTERVKERLQRQRKRQGT